ncbi:MAG: hypothetical protein HY520_01290 [Candidatus Aenigmarchaeota archaeon]|nr:hypothetical protein [Candidatus Aenigmarchaeota archaeon]
MGIIEEILKGREELLIKFLEILEGKESKATVNLDGVQFKVGKSVVTLGGKVDLTFTPLKNKK